MREAGVPSTGMLYRPVYKGVPAPPGTVMVALVEIPRNAQRAHY